MGNPITTISFDADDTLWDFKKVMKHALNKTLEQLRVIAPMNTEDLTIDTMIQIRNQVAEQYKGTVKNLELVRLEAFKQTLHYIKITDDHLAEELNVLYLKHRFEDIELYPDVLPALNLLREHYNIGLFSNGNSYPERCGLEGRFNFVVLAQDYGIEKPNPKIFEIMLKQAGCNANEILHVGDSLTNDVYGANQVGIKSVWLNRNGKPKSHDVTPDFEITSLTELVDICKSMNRN